MKSTGYSDQIVMKPEFSRQILEKFSNIKFHENPSNENRVVLCGWAGRSSDTNDEFESRFSQFFESS